MVPSPRWHHYPNLEHELEKSSLVIEAKDKEIAHLKEIIELRKKVTTPAN